eukprot:scaffold171824_cov68-Cyclotella_meneghiniana.AAC.4
MKKTNGLMIDESTGSELEMELAFFAAGDCEASSNLTVCRMKCIGLIKLSLTLNHVCPISKDTHDHSSLKSSPLASVAKCPVDKRFALLLRPRTHLPSLWRMRVCSDPMADFVHPKAVVFAQSTYGHD